jgi:hypothetical protein
VDGPGCDLGRVKSQSPHRQGKYSLLSTSHPTQVPTRWYRKPSRIDVGPSSTPHLLSNVSHFYTNHPAHPSHA